MVKMKEEYTKIKERETSLSEEVERLKKKLSIYEFKLQNQLPSSTSTSLYLKNQNKGEWSISCFRVQFFPMSQTVHISLFLPLSEQVPQAPRNTGRHSTQFNFHSIE